MKDPTELVDELLSTVPTNTRRSCSVCDHRELAEALAHFMQLKASGKVSAAITLTWFYEHKLQSALLAAQTPVTIRNHVKQCLGLDVRTGAPLR